MADAPEVAPGTREAILAALGTRDAASYSQRQAIWAWLRNDPDGVKAAWLKGTAPA